MEYEIESGRRKRLVRMNPISMLEDRIIGLPIGSYLR